MTTCAEKGCLAKTQPNYRLCCACFKQKWGLDEINNAALPTCLLQIVIDYCFLSSKDYMDYELFRFFLPLWSQTMICDIMLYQLRQRPPNFDMLFLIIDRFLWNAPDLWSDLGRLSQTNFFALILYNSQDMFQLLAQQYPVYVDNDVFSLARDRPNDDLMFYILSTNTASTLNCISETESPNGHQWLKMRMQQAEELSNCICEWRSERILRYLINNRYFENDMHVFMMLKGVASEGPDSFPYFKMICDASNKNDICNDQERLSIVIVRAIDSHNIPVFHYLSNLQHLHLNSDLIRAVAKRLNDTPTHFVPWLAQYPNMIQQCLNQKDTIFHWETVLLLEQKGAFACLDLYIRALYLLDRDVLLHLIKKKRKQEFYDVVQKMAHLGTEDQFNIIVQMLCNHWSLIDVIKLAKLKIAEKRLTIAVVRKVQPLFLSVMFFNGMRASHLRLFETWCDCDKQMLSVRDVVAGNIHFIELASQTGYGAIRAWIDSFCRRKQNQQNLKLSNNKKKRE